MHIISIRLTLSLLLYWCLNTVCLSHELSELVGVWIVESKSPDGQLQQTVEFRRSNSGIRGVWRYWPDLTREGIAIDNVTLEQGELSFIVKYDIDEGSSWVGRFLNKDHFTMTWVGEDGIPVLARVFRRASAKDIAELTGNAPKSLITKKIPLPPIGRLPSNGLAANPPMGWNTWNFFREEIDDQRVRQIADALVLSGLRDAGYTYLIIDDGWQGRRDENRKIHSNSKFPDMKDLVKYVHAKGLKFGIYSSPGPITCAGYIGSHGYEYEDAQTFAGWGIDYLKYDWCSAGRIYKTQTEMQALYQKMGAALQKTNRPIVYSLCQYGMFDVGSWGRMVGGNLWRTGGDTVEGARWSSIIARLDIDGNPENNGPSGWNDPDMMLIGLDGLTPVEYRFHMTLWAMLAAPLIIGNDIRVMPDVVKDILLNREVIAVDQDPLGLQGRRILKRGALEIWVKHLSDDSTAVALFNLGGTSSHISVKWADIGLKDIQRVRNLWSHTETNEGLGTYSVRLPGHGATLLRVEGPISESQMGREPRRDPKTSLRYYYRMHQPTY